MSVQKFKVVAAGKSLSSITVDGGMDLELKSHYLNEGDVVVRKEGLMDDQSSLLYVVEKHLNTPEADLRDEYGRFKAGVASYLRAVEVEAI